MKCYDRFSGRSGGFGMTDDSFGIGRGFPGGD